MGRFDLLGGQINLLGGQIFLVQNVLTHRNESKNTYAAQFFHQATGGGGRLLSPKPYVELWMCQN